ncbi:lytic transglycosylase domain-containing protein [Phycicoccus sp. SLBN-51]|uniref:lytic transglycosylase domain-containing protein n=1 Tax=Phycicoccus sp. SLBN-51 TaxID=2768447 RepID=UPI00116F0935|nr:lytic transglycosylase domain-containing protein [Phycicoccus sp. SLBN-51]TQJ48361.1 membrane-bound lytic murein transglycosylase B [Phycicoccus sp. SLBN-51]
MTREPRLTWRTVAAALPAVALIGAGSVLVSTGGASAEDVSTAQAKPVITVPAAPLTRPAAPVLPPLPPIPGEVASSLPSAAPAPGVAPAVAAAGIPQRALDAYQRAATLVAAADPGCGIDWPLIAAIGKVESDHGRYAGNGLDEADTVRPGIYGLPLNGTNNTAVIRDTDGGSLDRDTTWDRAVGPMQFIPGTWRSVGVDADGDGAANPQNLTDAATATGVYLCSGPGDLRDAGDLRSAILRYNQSDAYVAQVVAIAEGYRRGVSVLPSTDLTDAQLTGSPYLPSSAAGSGMPPTGPGATAATPRPRSTATSGRTPSSGGSTGGSTSTGSGSGSGSSGSGSGSLPKPTTTSSSTTGITGITDVVTGVVGGVTKPLQPKPSTTSPSPTSTSSPAPTPTSALEPLKPVTNSLGQLVCPSGYELRLTVPPMCYPT